MRPCGKISPISVLAPTVAFLTLKMAPKLAGTPPNLAFLDFFLLLCVCFVVAVGRKIKHCVVVGPLSLSSKFLFCAQPLFCVAFLIELHPMVVEREIASQSGACDSLDLDSVTSTFIHLRLFTLHWFLPSFTGFSVSINLF